MPYCKIVNNYYQQGSRVLYPLVANKSSGLLFEILPKNFIVSKAFNSEFSYI